MEAVIRVIIKYVVLGSAQRIYDNGDKCMKRSYIYIHINVYIYMHINVCIYMYICCSKHTYDN